MPKYHFDLGDSNDGPIGFCAEVRAPTRERAVEKLKEALPEDMDVTDAATPLTTGIAYVQIYFNPDAVTAEAIDYEDDVGLPPGDHEPPEVEGWEHVRTWQYPEEKPDPEFRLELYDTGKPIPDVPMRTYLGYKFYHKGTLVFEGEEFKPSPLHTDDGDQSVGALLAWLSLAPGDTHREYFDSYTPAQLDFAKSYGEELGLHARELEDEP
jgi:hypothetical protein